MCLIDHFKGNIGHCHYHGSLGIYCPVLFLDLGIRTVRLDLHHAIVDVSAVWYKVWCEGNCQISDGLAESRSLGCRTCLKGCASAAL